MSKGPALTLTKTNSASLVQTYQLSITNVFLLSATLLTVYFVNKQLDYELEISLA